MTPVELCEYMYRSMCENPKNRVICYGADLTEVLRAIIVEQDCDLWMDKWTEYTGIVFALVKPYFELAAECRAQRESLAEEHKNQKRRRTSLIVFGTITCLIYILLFIAAFR